MNTILTEQPDTRLKNLLQRKGVKQVALAKALDIDHTYLNLICNGWKTPSKDLRYRIARCLQVPETEIFEVRR